METKIKKTKKAKAQKKGTINRNKILYRNLLDLKALLSDKERYPFG